MYWICFIKMFLEKRVSTVEFSKMKCMDLKQISMGVGDEYNFIYIS